jgi:hypothetical protein
LARVRGIRNGQSARWNRVIERAQEAICVPLAGVTCRHEFFLIGRDFRPNPACMQRRARCRLCGLGKQVGGSAHFFDLEKLPNDSQLSIRVATGSQIPRPAENRRQNPPAVRFHGPPDDRHYQSRTLGLCRVEGLEYPLSLFGLYSRSVVTQSSFRKAITSMVIDNRRCQTSPPAARKLT